MFNPQYSPQTNNFAIEPIIVIVNSNSFCDTWYLGAMSRLDFKAYVNNKNYTIDNLKIDLEFANAKNLINPVLSYGSDIGEYIHELKTDIIMSIFLNLSCIIIEIVILSFFITMYMEKNKKCIFLKTINGYSFNSVHTNFFITLFLTQLISIIFCAFYLKSPIIGFNIFILLYLNKSNTINILKNN